MKGQIVVHGGVDQALAKRLIESVRDLVGAGARELVIGISSPGGSVTHGVTAYNFLTSLTGVKIWTHNLGAVDSIAGVIYASGARRTCAPNARFLMHGVTANFSQKTSMGERQLRERLESVRTDTKTIAGILAACTGHTMAKVKRDMDRGLVFGSAAALRYNLVHEICDEVFDPDEPIQTLGTP